MSPRIAGSAARPALQAGSGGGVEDVAEPRDRDARLMEILPDLRQPQHRLRDPARQHVEGDQLADRQLAVDDELGAEIERERRHDLADELHRLARPVAEADSTRKLAADIGGELLLPAPLHLRLDRHRLQRLDAGDALDQEGLVLGAAVEFLIEAAAEQRRHAGRDRDIEREGRRSRSRSATASRRTSPPGTRR